LDAVRWKLWLDELPEHPSISVARITAGDERIEDSEGLIRIRRPRISQPPELPPTLEGWIEGSIDAPFHEPRRRSQRSFTATSGEERVERFQDNPERTRDWTRWIGQWQAWADKERPARQALDVYHRFYELHGELRREGERYELVLADGILLWRWKEKDQSRGIYSPLILMPVQLRFDSSVPEFTISETAQNPELYTTPLRDAPLTNPGVLRELHDDIPAGEVFIHPLEQEDTTGVLKRLARSLSADGEFSEEPLDAECRTSDICPPRIWRRPLLMLRERTHGYSQAVGYMLEDLEDRTEPPLAFAFITSEGAPARSVSSEPAHENSDLDMLRSVLFTKPWNQEQLQIAQRLDRFGCVLVQGPPGTGKTHTIANLIGHLLAQGKSVLVTAYTSKALRVLREHIPEPLRALAVSVLDDDLTTRRQLEEAVHAITSKLNDDAHRLRREANKLEAQRNRLLDEIAHTRTELAEAIASEYRGIVVAGREYRPSEAARRVAEGVGRDDWIPGPVELGAALPLSHAELAELYRLNSELSHEEEREIRQSLPDPQKLPSPEEFEELVALLKESPSQHRPEWWRREPDISQLPEIETIMRKARELGELLLQAEDWELKLIEVGDPSLFEELLFQPAEELQQLARSTAYLRIKRQPQLPAEGTPDEHKEMAEELAQLAQRRGGKLSWTDTLLPSKRRRFVKFARVTSGRPVTEEHFRALAAEAALQKGRLELRKAWKHLVTEQGGPTPDDLEPEPERTIIIRAERLRMWLSFESQKLRALRQELEALGFVWERAYPDCGWTAVERGRELGKFLSDTLPAALEAAALVARQREAERRLQHSKQELERMTAPTVVGLREALERRDPMAYYAVHRRLSELWAKQVHLRRREELLERLGRVAPAWAEAIRMRSGAHGSSTLPGDPEAAWLWRQFVQELERRASASVQEIQNRLADLMQKLYATTQQLVEHRTWAYRIEKTTQEQRQALVGWLNTMRRLGKGKGHLAPKLRAQAAQLLAKAKDAVPVWIMPLARVAEQVDPRTTRFDVVIVDEASQCDMLGLIAVYVAENVVVVGDHEQVSPEGVGLELSQIERLQGEYLHDIPNAHLYDSKRSLYDIARESFGGGLMLTEHFRCVPEIIAFSNRLCYNGRIRPLRGSGNVPLKPHVVPYRVRGTASGKVNEEEAREIAALILAMLQHPAYAEKTIGVVSMVGDEQAKYIERLVRRACLDEPKLEQELEKRRLLCGNPAQFQGDERDVVLISLVDSPSPKGPLPLRSDERFKQRFNVAASRARDQLWVVYSLDPAVDLKEGDLRRELIEFALSASRNSEKVKPELEKAESPFEREVMEWLIARGYRVRAQWPVGYYRIDLVVEDASGRRVAIECDGDRYRPIERIPEDLERQAILERLGWHFIRIRGSEFYRDRESTMQRVVRELERLGVRPGGGSEDENTPPSLADEIIRVAKLIKARIEADELVEAAFSDLAVGSSANGVGVGRPTSQADSSAPVDSKPSARSSGSDGRKVEPAAALAIVPASSTPVASEPGELASFSEEEHAELCARLLEERERLCEELGEVERRIHTAKFSWERDDAARQHAALREKLQRIEKYLCQLGAWDEGYGRCMECRRPISIEQMCALPWTQLCVHCQARRETPPLKTSTF